MLKLSSSLNGIEKNREKVQKTGYQSLKRGVTSSGTL
jgi:hypothetical protein